MYSVKFSHFYDKMKGFDLGKPFKLIHLFYVDCVDIFSREFIERDTKYEGGGYYKLPRGVTLIVLVLKQNSRVMTTVRRYTPSKSAFYCRLVGNDVMVKVENE